VLVDTQISCVFSIGYEGTTTAAPESAVLPLNEGAVSADGARMKPHSDFIELRQMGQFTIDSRARPLRLESDDQDSVFLHCPGFTIRVAAVYLR